MGRKNKTIKEFKKEIYDLVGDEYTVLGEYKNTHTKILMRHNICNTEYLVTPKSFLNGIRCPNCFGNKKKTTEEFKKEVYNLVGDEYTVLGNYKNNDTKILIRHNICGTEYLIVPSNFLFGHRCPLYNNYPNSPNIIKIKKY